MNTRVILGLGANLGTPIQSLRKAIHQLNTQNLFNDPLQVSSVYESPALLPSNAPPEWNIPFLNLAVSGVTALDPQTLLTRLKEIEKKLERKKGERWSPRVIDIDLLAWGEERIELDNLNLPHAGLTQRLFAIGPMAELWPDWRDPYTHQSARQIVQNLKNLGTQSSTRRSERHRISPALVGILNLTPDSFSDGGNFIDSKAALERARTLIQAGAEIIDVGAESTRPGATQITQEQEWQRLELFLEEFKSLRHTPHSALNPARHPTLSATLSVDTRHPETARRAIQLGADWINDVTGFENPEMIAALADTTKPVRAVFMHSLGVPPTRARTLPTDQNPLDFLLNWAHSKINIFNQNGISSDRLIFDPGIGFGTTPEQSFEIIKNSRRFLELNCETLVGHSRKSFLSEVTQRPAAERDIETFSNSLILAQSGIHYLRVHAVDGHRRLLNAAAPIWGNNT